MSVLAEAVRAVERRLDDRIRRTVEEAAAVPAFAQRLADAGASASSIRGVADLNAVPVLNKDGILELQHATPPFGGLLAAGTRSVRIFQSPGPIYEPQLNLPDSFRWGHALKSIGFCPGDVVLNCFNYHMTPAGTIFDDAARDLGCAVVPAGVGNLDLQARLVGDVAVTGYIGLPSYLRALAEKVDPDRWQVLKAMVTAEPLTDSLRDELEQRVPTVRMVYGTAEIGLLGYEVEPRGGLRVPPDVLVQVCDINTGEPRYDDGEGEVVVTLLRPEYPIVRFGTGDLSAWTLTPEGQLRLVGVLGRVGQAIKVKGMFLHPRQVTEAMSGMVGIAQYRFIVDRIDHRDVLRCEVVASAPANPQQVVAEARKRIRSSLRFDPEVRVVDKLTESDDVITDVRSWS